MNENKIKSLSLHKLKVAEVQTGDDQTERRVTFVASTPNIDRDHEVVDIETFRLPLKGGGEILVGDLPAEGSTNVDIPFLTNHDLWDVAKTIGSVRKATFEDGQLVFEVGISSRDYAQDVFKLIEEGHLDNAFSIQFGDYAYEPETQTCRDGEIVEVSLVTRGSNKDAQVLEVKSLKDTETPEGDNTVNESEKTQETVQAEAPVQAEEQVATEVDEAKAEPEVEAKENEEENKEKIVNLNHKKTAAAQVKAPSQEATSGAFNVKSYLDSKESVLDYAKLSKKCGGDRALLDEAWKAHLSSKGITVSGGGSFMPTAVEQVIFKAWYDQVGPLSTFRRTKAKASRFYAMTTEDGALGHKKGEEKADQDITAIPRNAGLKVVYKKLPIDWIDIVNDDTGELYVFRERELYDRVLHAILRGSIVGDGLSAPSGQNPDYRVFDGTNGLYSMAADINGSSTADSYAEAVATLVANVSTDGFYEKIVKTLAAVRLSATGQRKVLVVPENSLTDLYLMKNASGQYLFAPGTDFRNVFNVSEIVELAAADFTRVGLDVIAYRDQGYTLGGPDSTVRNWFDGNKNLDYMMVEQPVFGSLEGYKVAAGYAAASSDNES